jgi:hypothetical protein
VEVLVGVVGVAVGVPVGLVVGVVVGVVVPVGVGVGVLGLQAPVQHGPVQTWMRTFVKPTFVVLPAVVAETTRVVGPEGANPAFEDVSSETE